jgi:hypothetical protein
MAETIRQLAAIMPARPKCNEGGFTDLSAEVPLRTKAVYLKIYNF